jgi:excinuclease ABC subunit A
VVLVSVVKGSRGHYLSDLLSEDCQAGLQPKVRVDGEILDITPKMQVDRLPSKIHDIEIVD